MSIKISRSYTKLVMFMLIVLIVLTADVFVLQSVKEGEFAQILPLAVGLDMTLVLPILCMLMLYRNSKNKWRILVPIMLAGYMMSKLFLYANGIDEAKLLGYIISPFVIIFFTFTIHHLIQKYRVSKENQQVQKPVYDTLKERIEKKFPQLKNTGYLVHEISMYYYLFFGWKKRPYIDNNVPVFTYHRKSIMLVMLFFLGFVLTAEGFAVHLLVMQWSNIVAWIMSIGSLYVMLLFISDYRAMVLNPIIVKNESIQVRYGLRAYIDIPISNVCKVSSSHTMEVPESEKKESIAPAMDGPNLLIECIEPVEVVLMFGQKRTTTKVYLHIDEPSEFQKLINSSLK